MEVGPDVFNPEILIEPDLYEDLADQVVTVFGITGTFRDLAGLCPIDLNGPDITLEAKNEFIVKVANEAKLEIKKEHEEYFARTIERLGLERNFTVNEKPTPPKQDNLDNRQEVRPEVTAEPEQPSRTEDKPNSDQAAPHITTLLERDVAIDDSQPAIDASLKVVSKSEAQTPNTTEEFSEKASPKPVAKARPLIRQIITRSLNSKKVSPINSRMGTLPTTPKSINKPASRESQILLPARQKEEVPPVAIKPARGNELIATTQEAEALPVIDTSFGEEPLDLVSSEELAEGETLFFNNDNNAALELDEDVYDPEAFNLYEQTLFAEEIEEFRLDNYLTGYAEGSVQGLTNDTVPAESVQAGKVVTLEGRVIALDNELPAPVGQVEATLNAITESLEEDEEGRIQEIMLKIISLPETIDNLAIELDEAGKEALIEEKLAELFVELFEEIGVEPTSELVQSFIMLTKEHFFDEVLVTSKTEEVNLGLPDEAGTREFLQKLLTKLNDMKKTAAHFYKLGRSALNLYNFRSLTAVSS